ncbi:MAG: hypothetical protein J0H14_09595 [Alphaproteobacteria bacterium]|nr:hypothetical protein [Rhodospirillales bacterium]MBN9560965.1 hypothetical protein [Alphaproteobacteria bacterium]
MLLPFFSMATGLGALIEPDSAAFLGVFIAGTVATMLGKVAGGRYRREKPANGGRWRSRRDR